MTSPQPDSTHLVQIVQGPRPPQAFLHLISQRRHCMHAQSLSRIQLFETPWTVNHQASQSMGFSMQEYWSGLPFPSRYQKYYLFRLTILRIYLAKPFGARMIRQKLYNLLQNLLRCLYLVITMNNLFFHPCSCFPVHSPYLLFLLYLAQCKNQSTSWLRLLAVERMLDTLKIRQSNHLA